MQSRANIERLTGVVMAAVLGVSLSASAQSPSVTSDNQNLVNDPTFNGQSPSFQSGGSISPDWNYTPDYLNFGGTPWTLVSQTLDTPDILGIYDINVQFALTPPAQALDFFVYWDGMPVANITSSDGWEDHNFYVTATGPTSDLGFVGNQSAWSTLGVVDVSWTGLIDPSPSSVAVADSPLSPAMIAGLFGSVLGLAAWQRRPALALQRCTK